MRRVTSLRIFFWRHNILLKHQDFFLKTVAFKYTSQAGNMFIIM